MNEDGSLPDGGVRDPVRFPRPLRWPRVFVAAGIPAAIWIVLAVLPVMFIWRALGHVNAQHAFLSEVVDYVVIAVTYSVVGSIVVVPLAVWVSRSRSAAAIIALVVVSIASYVCVHFMAIAMYSLRIT